MGPDASRTGLDFDVLSLVEHSSPPMLVLSMMLIASSVAVWFTAIVKFLQLRRWQHAERALRNDMQLTPRRGDLSEVLLRHRTSIGSQLLAGFTAYDRGDLVDSETEYLLTLQQERVFSGLTLLASIATAAPLAGLFGTVYGIMEAFATIGVEKSASLLVVAPAIGDALVTTILGLFAAIPAVLAYNVLSRQGEQLVDESKAFTRAWLRRTARQPGGS